MNMEEAKIKKLHADIQEHQKLLDDYRMPNRIRVDVQDKVIKLQEEILLLQGRLLETTHARIGSLEKERARDTDRLRKAMDALDDAIIQAGEERNLRSRAEKAGDSVALREEVKNLSGQKDRLEKRVAWLEEERERNLQKLAESTTGLVGALTERDEARRKLEHEQSLRSCAENAMGFLITKAVDSPSAEDRDTLREQVESLTAQKADLEMRIIEATAGLGRIEKFTDQLAAGSSSHEQDAATHALRRANEEAVAAKKEAHALRRESISAHEKANAAAKRACDARAKANAMAYSMNSLADPVFTMPMHGYQHPDWQPVAYFPRDVIDVVFPTPAEAAAEAAKAARNLD